MGSSSPHKPELPPLLQPGLHRVTMPRLRKLCVDAFPLSTTRLKLFDGLNRLLAWFAQTSIAAEMWIDGSFLTQKIDPSDVDLVLKIEAVKYFSWSDEQKDILEWLTLPENEDECGTVFARE